VPNKGRPTLFTLLSTKHLDFAVNYMRLLIIAAFVFFTASGIFAQVWTPWQVQTPRQRLDVSGKGEMVTFSQVDLQAGMEYRIHAEKVITVVSDGKQLADARYFIQILPFPLPAIAIRPGTTAPGGLTDTVKVGLRIQYAAGSEDWFNSAVVQAQQSSYQSGHVYDALVASSGIPLSFRFFDKFELPGGQAYYDDNTGAITIEVSRETPGIAVKYDTIDFGTVAVGKSKTLLDSIQGYGKGYQLENVYLTGNTAPFSAVSERTVPFGIKDATNEFQFTFAPTGIGPQVAHFHMISSSAFGADKDRIIVLIGNGGKAVVTSLTDTLDFGTIAVSTTKTLDAILRNSGNMDAEVQSVVVTPSSMPFSANTLPLAVAQAAQAGLAVTFAPLAVGPYFAAIDAKLDDGSTVRFYAKGNGGGAMVTSLTDTLDFGTIGVGTTKTLDATLQNTGFLDAQVVTIQVTPSSAPFSSSSLPLAVVKATQAALPITFAPPAVGPYFAAIDAMLDDGSSVRFYAKGNGGGATVTLLTDTLDFGTIAVGTTKTLDAILRNSGFIDAQLQSAQVIPTTMPYTVAGLPTPVVAAQQTGIPVTFAPQAVGIYVAAVDVRIDNGSTVRFYAKGAAGQGKPFFTRDTLFFDTVIIGLSRVLTTTFFNKEDAPGTGGPLTVTNSTNSNPEFSIIGNPGPFTKTVNSGEVYTVTFAPTTHLPNYGLHSGVFTLYFTDQGPKSVYFFGYDHLALEAILSIDSFYYVVAGDEIIVRQMLRSDLSGTLSPVRQLSQSITYDPTYFELLAVQKGAIISGAEWTLNSTLTAGRADISIASPTSRFGPGGEMLKLRFRAKPNAPLGAFTYLPQIGVDFGGIIEPLASSEQGKITIADLCTPVRLSTGGLATFIEQNSPNPFINQTQIKFSVGESAALEHVSLRIYDATGRLVQSLVDEEKSAGFYAVTLDAVNLTPGVYTYVFRSGEYSMTRKMVLTQ
jgi:hypothetical protein